MRLFGFSQGELTGGSDSLGQVLLSGQEDQLAEHQSSIGRTDYLNLIETGSYPEAQTRTPRRRAAWVDNYVTGLLSRDADRISTLAHLDRLPHLLAVLAANTSGELVKARVAADVNLPETSLPPYLDLLESFGLIHTLRPWDATCANASSGAPRSPCSTPVSRAAWLDSPPRRWRTPNPTPHARGSCSRPLSPLSCESRAPGANSPSTCSTSANAAAHRQKRRALRPKDVGPARLRTLAMTP